MIRTISFATVLVSSVLAGCAAQDAPTTPGTDELAGENGQDGEAPKADAAHDNFGFIAVEKNPAPTGNILTGSLFNLTRPNRTTLLCSDHAYHDKCGTHAIIWQGLTQTQTNKVEAALAREAAHPSIGVQVLVKGTFKIYVDFLAFEASEVWLAQKDGGTDDGTFVRIFDRGVRCITAPCPQYEEGRLNSSRTMATEGFDYGTSADDALQEKVYTATTEPDGVIVVGDRTNRSAVSFVDVLRTVNQVYLPVK